MGPEGKTGFFEVVDVNLGRMSFAETGFAWNQFSRGTSGKQDLIDDLGGVRIKPNVNSMNVP